jgi:hypothetical protein
MNHPAAEKGAAPEGSVNCLAAALLAAAFLWPVVAADPAVSVGPQR